MSEPCMHHCEETIEPMRVDFLKCWHHGCTFTSNASSMASKRQSVSNHEHSIVKHKSHCVKGKWKKCAACCFLVQIGRWIIDADGNLVDSKRGARRGIKRGTKRGIKRRGDSDLPAAKRRKIEDSVSINCSYYAT